MDKNEEVYRWFVSSFLRALHLYHCGGLWWANCIAPCSRGRTWRRRSAMGNADRKNCRCGKEAPFPNHQFEYFDKCWGSTLNFDGVHVIREYKACLFPTIQKCHEMLEIIGYDVVWARFSPIVWVRWLANYWWRCFLLVSRISSGGVRCSAGTCRFSPRHSGLFRTYRLALRSTWRTRGGVKDTSNTTENWTFLAEAWVAWHTCGFDILWYRDTSCFVDILITRGSVRQMWYFMKMAQREPLLDMLKVAEVLLKDVAAVNEAARI